MLLKGQGEEVMVVGGPLDGVIGVIKQLPSDLGFFVHQEGDLIYGYFDHHQEDKAGRRIFKPGRPKVSL